MNNHQFIVGDSSSVDLPEKSVHTIVTSPPYYQQRQYGGSSAEIGNERTSGDYADRLVSLVGRFRDVLRDDGTLWLNIGDKSINGEPGMIPSMVSRLLQFDGWKLIRQIIWRKASPMPNGGTRSPVSSWESVFLFAKGSEVGGKPYVYDYVSTMTPSKHWKGVQILPGESLLTHDRDVWEFPGAGHRGKHGAVMPTALAEKCIRLGAPVGGCCPRCGSALEREITRRRIATRPGRTGKGVDRLASEVGHRDRMRHVTAYKIGGWVARCHCGLGDDSVPCVVLDPFGGEGTTAIAADRAGCNSVSVELYPDYAEAAQKRLEEDRVRRKTERIRAWSAETGLRYIRPIRTQASFLENIS